MEHPEPHPGVGAVSREPRASHTEGLSCLCCTSRELGAEGILSGKGTVLQDVG